MTSKDLKTCYMSLLKMQKACGCNIDRRIKNNDCRTIECEFNEDRQCPIQALKHTILEIEIERSMNALADSFEGESHEVESQMLILTEDKTFAISKTCIQSMGVTFNSEENAYYVTVFMTDGNDTHMAGPFDTQEDAVYSLAEFVELINEDEPW